MQVKKCIVCGIQFAKPLNESKKNWNNRRKFCSIKCTNISFIGKPHNSKTKFKKGFTPWNKDTKRPEITANNHPMWKGGKLFNRGGSGKYIEIYQPNHPRSNSLGYVKEHRLVMEKYLGRFLEPQEVVHHINEIKDDNRLENLQLFANNGEHIRYHNLHLIHK